MELEVEFRSSQTETYDLLHLPTLVDIPTIKTWKRDSIIPAIMVQVHSLLKTRKVLV